MKVIIKFLKFINMGYKVLGTKECPGTFVECPGIGRECPGEITLIITLVTDKITYFMKD
jgi:hypothetical protein